MDQQTKQEMQRINEYLSTRVGTSDVDSVIKLVDIMLKDVQDRFLRASKEELVSLQAEGNAYDKLLREIKNPKPKIKPQGAVNV